MRSEGTLSSSLAFATHTVSQRGLQEGLSFVISAVIPVYNESASLRQLHAELREVAAVHGYDVEIVFIDDGSTDDSWDVIEQLATEDPRIKAIRFRRNFGKAAALDAGFQTARGDVVFTLDADLQDDPQELPRFLELLDGHADGVKYDVISGWKKKRHDPAEKVLPSRVFNAVVSRLTGVRLHDHNCGFKCYRGETSRDVRLYGELHRFVPVLAAARGWRIGELVVNHRARQHGKSKYGLGRYLKGFLDLITVYFITRFAMRPQHAFGTWGLICGGLGMVGILAALVVEFGAGLFGKHLPMPSGMPLMLGLSSWGFVLLGVQMWMTGLVAELLVARSDRRSPAYAVRQRIRPTSDEP